MKFCTFNMLATQLSLCTPLMVSYLSLKANGHLPPGLPGKIRRARDVRGQMDQAEARANGRGPPAGRFRGARDVSGHLEQAKAQADGD